MADWYVSSVAYAAIPVWQATHAYTVGNIVRPTAPGATAVHTFRCTVAGTSAASEPSWTTANTNNATRTDGTVTWTNITGQSAYGWSGCGGTLFALNSQARAVVGDRVFLSSDHTETQASAMVSNNSVHAFGLIQTISVNRAGSVPPTVSDIQNGATLATSGSNQFEAYCNLFWQGVTFSSAVNLYFNSVGTKTHYLKDCALVLNNATSTSRIGVLNPSKLIWDNTTVQFGNTAQLITPGGSFLLDLLWIDTASAIVGATIPTTLFTVNAAGMEVITCRGVDLSAITGTLAASTTGSTGSIKVLFDSCRIASGATRYGTPGNSVTAGDELELVNCFDGTNIINERYGPAGAVTIDRSTTLSGGAQDDVGGFSLKLVSSTRSDFQTMPLELFWLDVENTLTGSSKTATVEIISSGSLNNNDIRLSLEYMDTAGSSVADFNDSLASTLTAASALSASSVTWNSPPATPQKQKLEVTFTPQTAGRVRGLVRLGKISSTVWVNPQIAIT